MSDPVQFVLERAMRYRLLTAEEERRLAKRIERGDLEAKEQLINANLRLVLKLAASSRRPMPMADRVQDGMLGLIRAAEKFDWRKGYRFSTYATRWIVHEMQRGFDMRGRLVRIPAHLEVQIRGVRSAEQQATVTLGREPTLDEVAEAAGVTVEIVEFVRRIDQHPASLDQPVKDGGDDSIGATFLADQREAPGEEAADNELTSVVRDAVATLPPTERAIIERRFRDGTSSPQPMKAVADDLGLKRAWAFELERRALVKLAANPDLATLVEAA
jgi:RNA polymerase primary sigma factor